MNKLKQNHRLLFFFVLFLFIIVYALIFSYIKQDESNRINSLRDKDIEKLKTHYELTAKYFQIIADATVNMIQSDRELISILSEFTYATDTRRDYLRNKLYIRLQNHYERIKEQGVLQFHFLMPDNVTLLRMHKPSKYGDDLTNFKYSFKMVNQTQKPMSGLERGRTSPSYRNVRPLFDFNGKHIGAVDIAFAPEIIQKSLYDVNKQYSHFILKKELFDQRKWNRNDNINDYRVSIENDNYFEYTKQYNNQDSNLKSLVKPFKEKIAKDMSENKVFAIYSYDEDNFKIISFLPMKNMQNQVIAYLISYTDSKEMYLLMNDFYILNIIIIIVLLTIAIFIYRIISTNQELLSEKKKFYKLSQYDILTDLPNRSLLDDRLNHAIKKSKKEKNKFAVLFIDLDDFKQVNDSFGHLEGDELLKVVALRIDNLLREEDTIARLGGDEFIVIIENFKDPVEISIITNKILNIFEEPIVTPNHMHYISAGIGVSIYPDDSQNKDDLLKHADVAMYKAKSMGKNSVEFYISEMTREVVHRLELENELREAILHNQFVVYYQAQVDAKSNKLIGMEALVRWVHPTKGLIAPNEFIPVAEDTGLIVNIDRLVMDMAMAQVSLWYEKGFNPGVLALNLAIKQLQKADFVQTLAGFMKKYSYKASWLELEITESQIMINPEESIKHLQEINAFGIELAVDDFGTGYSSLSYLKKLPIDKLKIDQSFIKDIPEDEEDVAIVKAVIALANSLNLNVLAEGVETKEQNDFLVENGCKNIQGYYYSKPIPANEMEIFMSENYS